MAVHTLACAAHQIIHDINRHRLGKDLLFDSLWFRDEYRSQVVTSLKKGMNFFKHADKDPEGVINFDSTLTELFIFAAVVGLGLLGLKPNSTERAFFFWLILRYPEILTEEGRRHYADLIAAERRETFLKVDQSEFFDIFREEIDTAETPPC